MQLRLLVLMASLMPMMCVPDCCSIVVAQATDGEVVATGEPIKLEQTPYLIWSGFIDASVLDDGTIKSSVESKPVSVLVSRMLLVLEKGYTLVDLEVEDKATFDFVDPALTELDGNRFEMRIDKPGDYRAKAELDHKGKKVVRRFNFTIGKPKPPVPPDPPVPDSVNPFGAPGFRVMIVYESRFGVPRSISPAVRNYLDTKCVKDAQSGIAQRLTVDQNASFGPGTEIWQNAMKRGQKSLPWLVIGNEATGFEGPLPADETELLALLKKYGG